MPIPIFGAGIDLIDGDDAKRAERCLKKVQEVLDRYECVLIPVITIVGTNIVAAMDVQPKARNMPGKPSDN